MTRTTQPPAISSDDTLDILDPEALERGFNSMVRAYQASRSSMIAWFVVRYAQALCCHPDADGGCEQRCAWHRLAAQWRMLAQSPIDHLGSQVSA
ncbi:MAG: ATP dependent RNA helicase [Gammaproteobacteria bacterium]|nr:ATP dependent RNA helicase [Gammaproteobacteria bacterium]